MSALDAQPAQFCMDPASRLAAACTLAYQRRHDAAGQQLAKLTAEQRMAALLAVDTVRARLLEIVGPPPIPDGVGWFAISGPHSDKIREATP